METKNDNKLKLTFEPAILDFGTFNPQTPLTKLPRIVLKIHNKGEETICGRLITQVSWLIISNIHFTCEPGQTCEHEIRMSTGAPHVWKKIEYDYENLVLIDCNLGSFPVPGKYDTGARKSSKPQKKAHIPKAVEKKTARKTTFIPFFIILPIILIITLIILFIKPINLPFSLAKTEITAAGPDTDTILTLGAQTVFARVTQTQLALQPSETILPLQPSQTQEPVFTETSIPETLTFTPWPREEFSNPEFLVNEYFDHINNGAYDQAWNMLTEKFQKECCSISGNDDFTIYEDWWSHNVEKVEVNSAYLQEWDTNPARVLVQLKYTYTDGNIEDAVFMYFFITDETGQKLLIDEVQ